jgi:hypothetical protein
MKRACLIIIVILLLVPIISAQELNPNPSLTAQAQNPSNAVINAALIAALDAMETKLAKDLNSYNDENFQALDTRIALFLSTFQIKAILGILGLNLLSVGIIFYFINKNQRKIAYESVSVRKRQGDEDRIHFVDVLNQIRAKVDFLEEEAKRERDTRVLPAQVLEQQYGGAQYERGYDNGIGRNGIPQIDAWGNAVEEGSTEYPPNTYYDPATGLPWGTPGAGEYPPEGFI